MTTTSPRRPGGAEAMREAAAKVLDDLASTCLGHRDELKPDQKTTRRMQWETTARVASEAAKSIRLLPLPAGDTLSTGGWKQIETAPRGREVLLLDNSTGTHAFYSVGFRPPIDGEWQIEASRDYDFTPTHWQPIEPPPGE